jgi:hypothetical protein
MNSRRMGIVVRSAGRDTKRKNGGSGFRRNASLGLGAIGPLDE